MRDSHASVHAQFFHGGHFRLGHLDIALGGDKSCQFRGVLRGGQCQGVLGRYRHVSDPHQGVRAGGVDAQRSAICQGEVQIHPFRAAYPVALHGAHLLRPLVQGVQVGQQLLRVVGNPDKPLVYFAALHGVVAAPAAAVHHLLIGQHRLVGLAPVHFGFLLVGQALLKQARKKPLLPTVILWITGGDLAIPVIGKTQLTQLVAHVINVLRGPPGRRHLVLDSGVFCGQAKGVPAHGLQHVLALHTLVAGDHVGDGVVAHMPHVQLAAGIGEHGQAVKFLPGIVLLYGKAVVLQPMCLRGLFQGLWVVAFVHHGFAVASFNKRLPPAPVSIFRVVVGPVKRSADSSSICLGLRCLCPSNPYRGRCVTTWRDTHKLDKNH